MSDQPKQSILAQVQGEVHAQKLKALKGALKTLIGEYQAAESVRDAVLEKITDIVVEAGEDPENVAKLLAT